ncbi:hypothetical protein KZ820_18500 [Sphingomonas sp. RRHST34]|uniref:Uncharacterized protein n=1 Tax=Sphingomonas citri TaxID=2862499 RepID=A0ABS7BT03_9SPHN|nr:hypothetical protein [Sphingomonas citri]MBW6532738.1 hypothetical protein [Sphingomonas citri]
MSKRLPSDGDAGAKRLRGFEALVVGLEWLTVAHLFLVCAFLLRVIAERLGLASPNVTTGGIVSMGMRAAVLLGAYLWARRRLAAERSARS